MKLRTKQVKDLLPTEIEMVHGWRDVLAHAIAHDPKATSDPKTQRIDCVDTVDGKAEFVAVYKLVRVEKISG